MTTQIKPPQQQSSTSDTFKPVLSPKSFFLWRLFRHPLLLFSILVHGALLASPIPSEKKVAQPKIKDIPVTKTVSLKRTKAKPKSKPKPQVKPRPQATQALLNPQPVPKPRPTSPPIPKEPEAEKPKPEPKQIDSEEKEVEPTSPESKETKPSGSNPKKPDQKGAEQVPIENEEVESIFGELDQALINDDLESEFDYVPSPSDFPEPEKFFTPESIKAFDFKKNTILVASGGIINNPRYFRLMDPDAVLASLPNIPAFESASEPKPIGEYGGGPVYELKVGDKTYFINLVKAKSISKATFVVFWRWDPNKPPG